jgi:hypothetical protein
MVPLPSLPFLPKLHRFFEPEQAKTFMLVFGIALLGQWILPWSGFISMSWDVMGMTLWPLVAGAGFVTLSFVPDLRDKLKPNFMFLVAAGSGVVGLLWSFAGGGGHLFWASGLGLIGLASALTGLFLWARNGYQQLYWTLLLGGLAGLGLGLLVPLGGGIPLVAIFSQIGGNALTIIGGIVGMLLCLAFIALIALVVMNVFLKKEAADQDEVGRFGAVLFVAALGIPVVQGVIILPMLSSVLHIVLTTGIFLWLTVWGLVCFFEAKDRGENLLSFAD